VQSLYLYKFPIWANEFGKVYFLNVFLIYFFDHLKDTNILPNNPELEIQWLSTPFANLTCDFANNYCTYIF
jgi:hypothetical protein